VPRFAANLSMMYQEHAFHERFGAWVGCEYRPKGATSAGLGWLRRWP
jgi:hydroxypyruvate isomerase